MAWWWCPDRVAGAGLATGLFPPQDRDWGLPLEVTGLSSKAAQRVAREATVQTYDPAARALNEDWGTHYDGTQMRRWALKLGQKVVDLQAAEVVAYEQGQRPRGPGHAPELLVVGLDGGRVQGREKNPTSGSRWREDKVMTLTSYLVGDGKDRDPQALVTTCVATMGDSAAFGKLVRLEAERRGVRQARRVLNISDGAAWIDTQHQEHFGAHTRIVDWFHAVQHLHAQAQAVYPQQEAARKKLAGNLATLLWRGQIPGLIKILTAQARKLGPPQDSDPPAHPRRVAAKNVGYFTQHQGHMNYPQYRKRGWPIGSGTTESGGKQINKRVKGTEQFWDPQGVEPILALRALWLSQDQRWDHYWLWGRLTGQAA